MGDVPKALMGYKRLDEVAYLSPTTMFNTIGIINDSSPLSELNNLRNPKDKFQQSIKLIDPTMYQEWNMSFCTGLIKDIPKFYGTGHVLLLKQVKAWRQNTTGEIIGMYNFRTTWMLFLEADIPEDALPKDRLLNFTSNSNSLRPTAAECQYVWAIANHGDRSEYRYNNKNLPRIQTDPELPPILVKAPKRPVKEIQDLDLGPSTYVDIVGKILHMHQSQDKVTLYITDYTEHPKLYDYRESLEATINKAMPSSSATNGPDVKMDWNRPLGRRSLQITLWAQVASEALRVFQLDSAQNVWGLIKNVVCKLHDTTQIIEGVVHEDKRYPTRDFPVRLDHADKKGLHYEQIKTILYRKRDYDLDVRAEKKKLIELMKDQNQPKKLGDVLKSKPEKLTKNQRRRKRKLEDVEKSRREELALRQKTHSDSVRSNPSIQTSCAIDTPYTTIEKILDPSTLEIAEETGDERRLPFRNVHWRIKARVVDYFPKSIEDFAAPISEFADLSDNDEDEMEINPDSAIGWEWRFMLILEDCPPERNENKPRSRIKVQVSGNDAARLMNKVDATNFRDDEAALESLRFHLSILWGNLEEIKSASNKSNGEPGHSSQELSNVPFDCCLFEAGMEVASEDDSPPSWERIWLLENTIIKG